MTQYLVLKSCVAGGAARNAGDLVELSEQEATSLLAIGRVAVSEAREAPTPADRSVGLPASGSPAVAKRGKKE